MNMDNSNIQLLESIILKSDTKALFPFLKAVDKKEYPALRKKLIETHRKLSEFVQILGTNTWKSKMTDIQSDMFTLSGLVLCNSAREYSNINNTWRFTNNNINNQSYKKLYFDYLELAKPKWLDQFFDNFFVDYVFIRELNERGFLTYNPNLFVNSLMSNTGEKTYPEFEKKILADPLIYQRDLPAIFDHSTNIVHYAIGNWGAKDRIERPWNLVIKKLIDLKLWDKQETLQKCIETLKKDWKTNLLNWYRDLFIELTPTTEELLAIQTELIYLLPTTYVGAVNFAIGELKKIHTDKAFDAATFVEFAASVLHRKDAKGSIRTILAMYEKLGAENPDLRPSMCLNACNALLVDDTATQEKAVKLIAKFGNPEDEELKQQITQLDSAIKGDLKKHLAKFYDITSNDLVGEFDDIPEKYTILPQNHLKLTESIEPIDNWNDFVFHIGKVLSAENIQVDLEIFMQSFENLASQFPADYKTQLMPYKKQLSVWGNGTSLQIFHHFLLHWLGDDSHRPFVFKRQYGGDLTGNFVFLQHRFTELYAKLLLSANRAMAQGDRGGNEPILSAITHAPYWIDPVVFVEKLLWYEKNNIKPDNYDLCAAICRIAYFEKNKKAFDLAQQLTGENKDLVLYMFGDTPLPTFKKAGLVSNAMSLIGNKLKAALNQKHSQRIENDNIYYILAARSKNPERRFEEFADTAYAAYANVIEPDSIEWHMENVVSTYKSYGSNEYPAWYELRFKLKPHNNIPALLYSNGYNSDNSWWDILHDIDFDILISYIPSFTDSLYLSTAKQLRTNNSTANNTLAALRAMIHEGFVLRPIHHMFLSLIFFNEKKEHRAFAAEVLIELINTQVIDIQQVGHNIAELVYKGYGSLSRPLDCLVTVKDVSSLHNVALKEVYEIIIVKNFEENTAPKYAKKLLEDYFDVLVKTNHPPSVSVIDSTKLWTENATLKKIITSILEKGGITPIQKDKVKKSIATPVLETIDVAFNSLRKFEYAEGSSNKFWHIAISDNHFKVIYGRIGTNGQEQIKTFLAADICQNEVKKLIFEKTKKGYKEVV